MSDLLKQIKEAFAAVNATEEVAKRAKDELVSRAKALGLLLLDVKGERAAMEMTKAKCRELYEQMDRAITEFEEALEALCKRTVMGIDDNGKYVIESPLLPQPREGGRRPICTSGLGWRWSSCVQGPASDRGAKGGGIPEDMNVEFARRAS